MIAKSKLTTLALGALLIVLFASSGTAAAADRIISLSVQVSSGGHSLGTYGVKPAQTIPTHAGATYTLTLVGTQISGGKATTVPVNATFEVHAGKGRLVLSNPGDNSTDVKVVHKGPQGNMIKYTVASGYNIRKGLATGYISLY